MQKKSDHLASPPPSVTETSPQNLLSTAIHDPIEEAAYIKVLSLFTALHGLHIDDTELKKVWRNAAVLEKEYISIPPPYSSSRSPQLSFDYLPSPSASEKIAYALQRALNTLKFDAHIRFGTVQKLLRSPYPLIMIDQQSEVMVVEGIQNDLLLLKGNRKISPVPIAYFHKIFSNLWINATLKTRNDKRLKKNE